MNGGRVGSRERGNREQDDERELHASKDTPVCEVLAIRAAKLVRLEEHEAMAACGEVRTSMTYT